MNTDQIAGGCPMGAIVSTSNKILIYTRKQLKKIYGDKRPLRAFHAKTIGLVKAKLTVAEGLPDNLKVGLFKAPKTYDAWIRFTNGKFKVNEDIKNQVRGMAIKVLNVEDSNAPDAGGTGLIQDIILMNSRIFVPGALSLQMMGVRVAFASGIKQYILAFLTGLKTLGAALQFKKSIRASPNILEEMYYSATPYAFGDDGAIKWHARPLKTITSVIPSNPDHDFLRHQLTRDLAEDSKVTVAFDLFVQRQENKDTEPIDDSTVEWKTAFQKVATIEVPKQLVDTTERKAMDKLLNFSPGYSLYEHRPLGLVNSIRSKVYEILAEERKGIQKFKT